MIQDLSGKNCRGHSFKGQNLEGANFSYADIRSADFTGANLTGANFSHAQAGLQKRWAIFLVCVSWLLSVISGFLSAFTGALIALIFNSSSESQVAGWTVLIVVIGVFIVILRQGFNSAIAMAMAMAISIAFAFAFAMAFAFAGAGAGAGAMDGAFAGAGAGAMAIAFAFVGAIAGAGAMAMAMAIAKAFAIAIAGAGAIAIVGAIAGAIAGALFSAYIGGRAMKGDEKYSLIRNIAVAFATFGGTSFRNANLTDADFTTATLKSTDFRKANLTRTCFHKTKKLDRVRPGKTYLQNGQLLKVLMEGQGREKNFDREDLRGVNFEKANLVDTSFIGADLSQANLQDADLSRAILVQAQLNGTDFTGATLTGAYIQDWGITTDTKFDGVRCEYVYMRLATKENPDPLRKPDNNKEVFADGEFGDFIKPIFDTLDLYHNQDVDPRAIAISFKQLAENHPEADLRIVGMEVRGEDKFLLRAKTTATADKSQLSAEYSATYNQIKGLSEGKINLLIAEKDNQIRRLENMVMTALERPNYYSSTQIQEVGSMASNPGGFSVGGSVGGNVNNVQGDNNRAVQGDNNQAVLGDNNQVTQQNEVGADTGEALTKEDIVKLLAQLETLIQDAELPADTKEEVIEDLNAAKNATDKAEPNKQRALDRLTSVRETLEKTTKTVDSGKQLWTVAKPIIVRVAGWLGAAAGL
ncbi:pentapeptide repeat-containing protein [Anabaena sp. CS-542/02]|uniref:pentapeptide repeat-containing protein n=1 Tax=Anabaena sp. CS-542/02 TaxID=3021719 RepID=UPI00232C5A57|nr:pentapeptide repeat-containing protein [Anabaena sp. CS-542/02]MDB9445212.1 pentapeptide repeat-containing protein [Anabaena sp. CS-542/02]